MTAVEALSKITSAGVNLLASQGEHGSWLVQLVRPDIGLTLASGVGVTAESAIICAARKLL